MIPTRIIETDEGIQDPTTVEQFDRFARFMRDRNWNNVDTFITHGVETGHVLELGPGMSAWNGSDVQRRPD